MKFISKQPENDAGRMLISRDTQHQPLVIRTRLGLYLLTAREYGDATDRCRVAQGS